MRFLTKRFIWEYDPTLGEYSPISDDSYVCIGAFLDGGVTDCSAGVDPLSGGLEGNFGVKEN